MTKKLAILFAAVSLLACSFTACDDKDDNDQKAAIGENCKANDDCASGNCDMTNKDQNDGNGKCAASNNNGKDDGAACDKDADCKSGWCKAKTDAADSAKECAALLKKDDDCTKYSDRCGTNLKCETSESDANKKVCVTKKDKVDIGGECTIHAECDNSYCKKESGAAKGVCTALIEKTKACTEHAECQTGYCDEVCSDNPSGNNEKGDACNSNSECKSNNCVKNGSAGTCGDPVPCGNFEPHCDTTDANAPVAYKSCSVDGNGEAVYDKETCAKDKCVTTPQVRCKTGDEECADHSNCPSNKFCSPEHTCVDSLENYFCNTENCTDGTCIKGICVTQIMLDKAEAAKTNSEESCSGSNFRQDFCEAESEVLVYCNSSGHVERLDCNATNAGRCSIIDTGSGHREDLVADCSGNAEMNLKCSPTASYVQLCYADEPWYGRFYCATDLKGEKAALYKDGKQSCTGSQTCGYKQTGEPECQDSSK